MKNKLALFSAICLLALLFQIANAETIRLYVPIVTDSPKQHEFFHDLLEQAIQSAGYQVELIAGSFPQARVKNMLHNGALSIYWMVESAQRNEAYILIETGITNGLIGKRILLIKKGNQHLFNQVNSLDDFRKLNLTGGMGKGWFDVNVWRANNLNYEEKPGNWRSIFKMIAKGRYDYFSRGLNEIVIEAQDYPDLAIEKRLVLIYDRDFRFYLSKTGKHAGAQYKDILNDIFKKAQQDGLIERLVRKYWGNDFKALNYDKRVKIKLKTPK